MNPNPKLTIKNQVNRMSQPVDISQLMFLATQVFVEVMNTVPVVAELKTMDRMIWASSQDAISTLYWCL